MRLGTGRGRIAQCASTAEFGGQLLSTGGSLLEFSSAALTSQLAQRFDDAVQFRDFVRPPSELPKPASFLFHIVDLPRPLGVLDGTLQRFERLVFPTHLLQDLRE